MSEEFKDYIPPKDKDFAAADLEADDFYYGFIDLVREIPDFPFDEHEKAVSRAHLVDGWSTVCRANRLIDAILANYHQDIGFMDDLVEFLEEDVKFCFKEMRDFSRFINCSSEKRTRNDFAGRIYSMANRVRTTMGCLTFIKRSLGLDRGINKERNSRARLKNMLGIVEDRLRYRDYERREKEGYFVMRDCVPMLKRDMVKAVEAENYERAAVLRDQIEGAKRFLEEYDVRTKGE